MKNSWVKSLVLFVVLVAGGIYAYKVEYLGEIKKTAADNRAKKILSLDPKSVTKISISAHSNKVELVREKDGWKITAPVEAKGDENAIEGLLHFAVEASASDSATGNPQEYGLEPPMYRVDFFQGEKSESLLIGQKSPTGSSVYVKTSDRQEIMLAEASLFHGVAKTLFDLRDKRLLDWKESDIGKIELTRDKLSVTLEKQADGKWRVTSPANFPADEREAKGLISSLLYASAVEFADGAPEQTPEFSKPQAKISLWKSGEKRTFVFGEESKSQNGTLVKIEGGGTIAVLPSTLVARLPKTADDLRDKKVFALDGNTITGIILKSGGRELELKKDDKGIWQTLKGAPPLESVKASNLAFSLSTAETTALFGEKEFKEKGKGPSAEVTVRTSAKTFTILASKGSDGKTLYGSEPKEGKYFAFDANELAEFLQ